MKIQRNHSGLTFRPRRRRRDGFLPLTILVMILLGVVMASRNWLYARLTNHATPPSSADLQSANRAFDAGNLDAAVNLTRQVWATHPDQTEALILLVRALIYRSYTDYNRDIDRAVALQLTTEAIRHFPQQPDALTAHALALQANESPVEAWNIARGVLDRYPDNTLARITLALAYSSVGGYETARRESQIAVDTGEWRVDALRVLAISLSDLGRYQEAVDTVTLAIDLNNKLLALHFEQALYALQIGDTDTASVAYFRVLAFDPDNVKARLRLCELSSQLGNQDRALDYCREVTARAPGWVEGWYMQGRVYFLQGDFAPAQISLHRCSTLAVAQNLPVDERPFECWYWQGQAAQFLGDCDGLLATYHEFQTMAAEFSLPQTWIYPPEGPPNCVTPTPDS